MGVGNRAFGQISPSAKAEMQQKWNHALRRLSCDMSFECCISSSSAPRNNRSIGIFTPSYLLPMYSDLFETFAFDGLDIAVFDVMLRTLLGFVGVELISSGRFLKFLHIEGDGWYWLLFLGCEGRRHSFIETHHDDARWSADLSWEDGSLCQFSPQLLFQGTISRLQGSEVPSEVDEGLGMAVKLASACVAEMRAKKEKMEAGTEGFLNTRNAPWWSRLSTLSCLYEPIF